MPKICVCFFYIHVDWYHHAHRRLIHLILIGLIELKCEHPLSLHTDENVSNSFNEYALLLSSLCLGGRKSRKTKLGASLRRIACFNHCWRYRESCTHETRTCRWRSEKTFGTRKYILFSQMFAFLFLHFFRQKHLVRGIYIYDKKIHFHSTICCI